MATPQTLQTLIQNPNFGINNIIASSVEKLKVGEITDISVDDVKLTVHLLTEGTQGNLTNIHPIFRRDNTNPDNVAFFQKIDAGHYYTRGVLDAADLQADLLPLYTANLQAKMGYGTNPQILDVIQVDNKVANRAIIKFTTDNQGVVSVDQTTGTKTFGTVKKKHQAYWTLTDPKKDFPHIYVVPKSAFNTPLKFLKIVAALFGGLDVNSLSLDFDPTLPNIEKVNVLFSSTALLYSGFVTVSVPDTSAPIVVYDEVSGNALETYKSFEAILIAANGTSTSTTSSTPPTSSNTTPPVPTPPASGSSSSSTSTPATGTNASAGSSTSNTPATGASTNTGSTGTTTTPAVSYDAQLSNVKTWTDNATAPTVTDGNDVSLLVRGHNLTADTTGAVTASVTNGSVTLGSTTVTIPKDGSVAVVDVLPHDLTAAGTLAVTVADAKGNTLATATCQTATKPASSK